MHKLNRFLVLFVIFSVFFVGCDETAPPNEILHESNNTPVETTSKTENTNPDQVETRSFLMGFSSWPPSIDSTLNNQAYSFMRKHGDIFERHEDDGMPWVEALNGDPLPQAFLNNWADQKSLVGSDQKIFLMVSPLGMERNNLAPYYGESDNMPLPADWQNKFLGDKQVQIAYLRILKEGIEFWHPDYLSIGSEVNVMMHSDFDKWKQYKEFHKFIYTELKKDYPNLPIFATFTIQEMRGEAEGSNKERQIKEIKSLLPYLDIIGISAYSYGWNYWPTGKLDPIPDDFFDVALQFKKPIAITESGAPNRDFKALGINYKFDDAYQKEFLKIMLETAQNNDVEFVINYASYDFDKLLEIIPPGQIREVATIWAYTGLVKSNGIAKPALSIWDEYYAKNYTK